MSGSLLEAINDALIRHWSLSVHRQPGLRGELRDMIQKALADARDEALNDGIAAIRRLGYVSNEGIDEAICALVALMNGERP